MPGKTVFIGRCVHLPTVHHLRNTLAGLVCGLMLLSVGCSQPPPPPPHVTNPTADAGFDRTVALGQKVFLNARINMGDGFTYAWTQTAGPSATLSDANQPRASFVPTEAGSYKITLAVRISDLEDTDTVTIVAVDDDEVNPPVANAGADRTMPPKTVVELDGRASYDPDGQPLGYRWRQIDGPAVELANAGTARPTFTAPETASDLRLEFELFVEDDQQLGDTDTVVITVSPSADKIQYNLGTLVQGGGSVVPSQGAYDEGSDLNVTASAHAGWRFDRWEGDFTGTTNPLLITFDANTFIIAVFEKVGFTLTIEVEGQGSVEPDGGVFESFTEVTLTPTPTDENWKFDRWQGDLTESDNPATIIMDKNKTIKAVFIETNQVSAPAFDPPAYTRFNGSVAITITSATPEAGIYYTLDGSDPTSASTPYTDPIVLTKSTTIKARAYKTGMTPSVMTSANYQTMMVPGGISITAEDR
jgi:hypothetical protein